jgi:tRNA threonylcarbamoyladenosine biosynthesis protein TsaE
MKEFISHSIKETEVIATKWLADVSNRYVDDNKALVVGLSGHLGAGKTAFVKAVAKELGIKEEVTSPTFVIMKMYDIDSSAKSPWKRLVHIDAYRLEQPEELAVLNWKNIIADKDNLIMVEWPENVGLDKSGISTKISCEAGENGVYLYGSAI